MVHLEEARNYFWGLTLENEKKYTQTVASTFHISMAALEPEHGKRKDEHVCVMLQQGESEYLLCTLNQSKLLQQTLDLNFNENEEITFFLNGKGRVHLTGFLVPDDPVYESSDGEAESSDDESDEDFIPTLQNAADSDESDSDSDEESTGGKRKKKQDKGLKKRLMLDEAEVDSDDDDQSDDDDEQEEIDDDDDDDIDMDLSELLEEASTDEDSDDESAEDTEGSFIAKPQKKQKLESPAQNKEETPSKKKKNKKKKKQEQQQTPEALKVESSDAATPESSEKKKKKKKKKNKSKENGDATPNKEADKGKTPQSGNTPGSAKKGRKQVLEGGVIVEDLKEGHGQAATPGRMTGVYYTGRLQNNKEFDSTKHGPPFKFRLGSKEVIKGWDVGVKGMKVGGKRRITVPAKMGYGSTRQGPIPANSTLVFDVELKSVS